MSEEYSYGMDDQRARPSSIEHASEHEYRTKGPGDEGPNLSATSLMLRDLRLGGHANSQVRATVIQRMQQTHGNRAVQRFIQRKAVAQSEVLPESEPLRVQRFLDELIAPIQEPFTLPGMGGLGEIPSFNGLPDLQELGIGMPFIPGLGGSGDFEMPCGLSDPMDPELLME